MRKHHSNLTRFMVLIALASLGLAAVVSPAGADPATATSASQPSIKGFRSADFGIDEAAVRASIFKDFGLPDSAARISMDPLNQTEDITVTIPALIDGLGKADIEYVLGYKTHRLTEVIVAWSTQTDATNSAPAMVRIGNNLRGYFLREGFLDPGIKLGKAGEILLFHATDTGGHAVLLAMHGTTSKPDSSGHEVFTPAALIVGYFNDPNHPDVFTVPTGAF